MFGHYLNIALRNLRKNTLFSLINVAGLALGMAACILIFLYLQFEWSFDRFHRDKDRIFRVLTVDHAQGVSRQIAAVTTPALGPEALADLPEVEDYCRVRTVPQELLSAGSQRQAYAAPLYLADSTFFSFFAFRLLSGDPQQVLAQPFSMVITSDLAQRLFGGDVPVGRAVVTAQGDTFSVTGICQNPPENSHLYFAAITSLSTQRILAKRPHPDDLYPPTALESWDEMTMPTYLRLAPGTDWRGMDTKLTSLLRSNGVGENFAAGLQPLADIHLHSTRVFFDRNARKSDASADYILAAVAVLVLIIASVNFINLSTARAVSRAREVGLRKSLGATRRQLVTQFLGESLVLSTVAVLLALSVAELTLPQINALTGYHLKLSPLTNFPLFLGCLTLTLAVGLVAGSYPALVLSGFRPIEVLKGSFQHSYRGRQLRRTLVVLQFTLAIALICAALTINRQLHYIRTKDLGYGREHVLFLDINNPQLRGTVHALRQQILASPHIASVGMANSALGRGLPRVNLRVREDAEHSLRAWNLMTMDQDALRTLQLTLLQGRAFSPDVPADTAQSILINEAAARDMNLPDPLAKHIVFDNDTSQWEVIGVVRDFHFGSLREEIEPLIFAVTDYPLPFLLVRTRASHVTEAITDLEQVWKRVNPNVPLTYRYMDDEFDLIHRGDTNFARIVSAFSSLMVMIACLGLFGLASHMAEQRRKEIAIRRVLGASVAGLCGRMVADYLRWVALANLLAWPVAFWATQRWLDRFAYHTDMTWIPFALASVIALCVALLTVSGRALRAATGNPAASFRYE